MGIYLDPGNITFKGMLFALCISKQECPNPHHVRIENLQPSVLGSVQMEY